MKSFLLSKRSVIVSFSIISFPLMSSGSINVFVYGESLKNIFKEMHDDIGIENNSPDLTKWADQGVLLLNTSLSVCEGLPNSHSNIGWEIFTDAALRELNQLNYVVYILWGAHARSKKKLITNSSLILEATHPSPLSAHKGFFGSNHFSKANEYLTRFRDSPINWQLD